MCINIYLYAFTALKMAEKSPLVLQVRMDELKKLYWDQIKDLAPLNIARPIRSVSALDAKNKEVKPETPGPAVAVDPPALPAEVAA